MSQYNQYIIDIDHSLILEMEKINIKFFKVSIICEHVKKSVDINYFLDSIG